MGLRLLTLQHFPEAVERGGRERSAIECKGVDTDPLNEGGHASTVALLIRSHSDGQGERLPKKRVERGRSHPFHRNQRLPVHIHSRLPQRDKRLVLRRTV